MNFVFIFEDFFDFFKIYNNKCIAYESIYNHLVITGFIDSSKHVSTSFCILQFTFFCFDIFNMKNIYYKPNIYYFQHQRFATKYG